MGGSFKIVLNTFAGYPVINVDTFQNTGELNEKLANSAKNKYIWGNDNILNENLLTINNTDANFCNQCYYLIAITTKLNEVYGSI
jgi:hypothetical protein